MPLSSGQRRNFETLQRAFLAEDAALMECQLAATGEPVAVICAAIDHLKERGLLDRCFKKQKEEGDVALEKALRSPLKA
ncbi:MAG: DUF6117 family protein, partial [Acidobacteriota bacterium]